MLSPVWDPEGCLTVWQIQSVCAPLHSPGFLQGWSGLLPALTRHLCFSSFPVLPLVCQAFPSRAFQQLWAVPGRTRPSEFTVSASAKCQLLWKAVSLTHSLPNHTPAALKHCPQSISLLHVSQFVIACVCLCSLIYACGNRRGLISG